MNMNRRHHANATPLEIPSAHPERHRRDYIIYRAAEDASPDGRIWTPRKKRFEICEGNKSTDGDKRPRGGRFSNEDHGLNRGRGGEVFAQKS